MPTYLYTGQATYIDTYNRIRVNPGEELAIDFFLDANLLDFELIDALVPPVTPISELGDFYGDTVQAFAAIQGQLNKGVGTVIEDAQLVRCVEAGSITLTWPDDTTDDVAMDVGDDLGVGSAVSVTVVAGVFHYM